MRKLITAVLLVTLAVPVWGDVFEGQAAYVGGTVVGVNEGTIGRLDTTQEATLVFEHPGGKLVIPYAKIESWDYQHVVAHHAGVVPTLAIVMVKYRQRRHYFHFQYKDDAGTTQGVVMEVPKQMPKVLSAVLEARVKGCRLMGDSRCVAAASASPIIPSSMGYENFAQNSRRAAHPQPAQK